MQKKTNFVIAKEEFSNSSTLVLSVIVAMKPGESLSIAAIVISIIFASTHNAKKQQMTMVKMAEKLKLSEQQLDDLRRILEKENRDRDS